MKLLVLLTLSVVLGLGCASGNKKKYPWRHYETTTPQGYRVAWVDEGDHGPENGDVYRWHAMAVESGAHRLFSTYEGPTYEQLIEVAKRVRWVLHDNCCFVASDGRTWAAGERIPSSGWGEIIRVGLYTRRPDQMNGAPCATVPPDAPRQTVRENPAEPGSCRWGEFVAPGFPATGHELGHVIWGPQFEHGWRPPVRANPAKLGSFRMDGSHFCSAGY